MIQLKADKREIIGKAVNRLREQNILPAVLYGPEIKNVNIKLNLKDFEKVYKEAGESSLISLNLEGKVYSVLIHEVRLDPLKSTPLHVDFYQPILTEEVEAWVPLVFEGEAPAVKDLGGTLIKEVQEIEVSALPEKLPHEIKVDVSSLKTFEDEILVKDLKLPEGVSIDKEPEDIIALVTPPEKEEEFEKPAEEEAEKVEGIEGGEKQKEESSEEKPKEENETKKE
jgi:large subunit ribosomal protein L25